MSEALKRKVTVCASCLRASCWQGEFYCDEFKHIGTTEKTVGELQKLDRESSDYWSEQSHE